MIHICISGRIYLNFETSYSIAKTALDLLQKIYTGIVQHRIVLNFLIAIIIYLFILFSQWTRIIWCRTHDDIVNACRSSHVCWWDDGWIYLSCNGQSWLD